MSHNPFLVTKVDTLQDAFPTVNPTILENTLWLENGDMNKTFERLLAMTDPPTAPGPPPRTTTHPSSTSGLPPVPPPRIRPPNISSQQVKANSKPWSWQLTLSIETLTKPAVLSTHTCQAKFAKRKGGTGSVAPRTF